MNRKKLGKILSEYYSVSMVKKLCVGVTRPSFDKVAMLKEKHNIPFEAWLDIKEWLSIQNPQKRIKNE